MSTWEETPRPRGSDLRHPVFPCAVPPAWELAENNEACLDQEHALYTFKVNQLQVLRPLSQAACTSRTPAECSQAVADAWDSLKPSSRFRFLASSSITASFFVGTPRQARQAPHPTPCPAGEQQ
ncbi:unnamed protein product [Rangifer tarandus platyrhynchus]|uniref:Uncharacterized protein n=2 Tax=Rangifer tarandus platyrhynchus TaxID=3082113 RepID=A0ACB0ENB7_RANTA|nr:unnamed protein product [Rangifer tarandus platyrhynchus]CAI9701919.1 unnamed protein product [Rangifer tarandus platyrhynchus]